MWASLIFCTGNLTLRVENKVKKLKGRNPDQILAFHQYVDGKNPWKEHRNQGKEGDTVTAVKVPLLKLINPKLLH